MMGPWGWTQIKVSKHVGQCYTVDVIKLYICQTIDIEITCTEWIILSLSLHCYGYLTAIAGAMEDFISPMLEFIILSKSPSSLHMTSTFILHIGGITRCLSYTFTRRKFEQRYTKIFYFTNNDEIVEFATLAIECPQNRKKSLQVTFKM